MLADPAEELLEFPPQGGVLLTGLRITRAALQTLWEKKGGREEQGEEEEGKETKGREQVKKGRRRRARGGRMTEQRQGYS